MAFSHRDTLVSRWGTFSLMEQLGNIGSEVGRARRAKGKEERSLQSAVDRALELYDLTLDDPRWRGRLREIALAREAFCDSLYTGNEFHTSLEDLERYFLPYAILARRRV